MWRHYITYIYIIIIWIICLLPACVTCQWQFPCDLYTKLAQAQNSMLLQIVVERRELYKRNEFRQLGVSYDQNQHKFKSSPNFALFVSSTFRRRSSNHWFCCCKSTCSGKAATRSMAVASSRQMLIDVISWVEGWSNQVGTRVWHLEEHKNHEPTNCIQLQ